MELVTLAVLLGVYTLGRRGGVAGLLKNARDTAEKIVAREIETPTPAVPAAAPDKEAVAGGRPPRNFSTEARAKLVDVAKDGRSTWKPDAATLLERRLARTSLSRTTGPQGLLVFRLVPLQRKSALEAVQAVRARGGSVAFSLTCFLQRGDRLVVFAPKLMPAMFARSPHFAAFAPSSPAAPPPPPKRQRKPRPAKPAHVNGVKPTGPAIDAPAPAASKLDA